MASPQARKPDRFTGLPSGVAVGPLGRRFAAYLVDAVVPTVIVLVAFGVPGGAAPSTGATAVGTVLLALWGLVVWWLLATRAASPGMLLLKLQLVGFTDGRPIGWGRVLLRAAVLGLLTVTGIGLLLMVVLLLRHPRRQGWHDLAGNAVVIQARVLPPRGRRPSQPAKPAVPPQVRATASPTPSAAEVAPAEVRPAAVAAPAAPAKHVPVPVPAPAPAPSSPPTADDDVADLPAAARRSLPGPWVAVLDDGREVAVTGLVLLGRNPQPRPGEEGAELIKLSDESRTVSKSHLALDVDERGLFVVDRDSTNGSTLTTPSGEAYRCVPGRATYIGEGSVVSVGDHWLTIHVGAVDRDSEESRPR